MTCQKERTTQHHLGVPHGHGCVADSEILIFAVFESTPRIGNRLAPNAFKSKKIRDGDISLFRSGFTSRADFEAHVIPPKAHTDTPSGVVVCGAELLRTIRIPHGAPHLTLRAVCVIDKVEDGDHDGHAAIESSEEIESIVGETSRGRARSAIANSQADAFSEICDLDSILP